MERIRRRKVRWYLVIICVAEVSEADQAYVQNVSNTPSHPVVDKNMERIIEDVSTDADVSDAMRSNCNNDGSISSKAGLEQVLKRGPWMIRKSPIILNKWSSSVSLKKGEVTKVLVWVKLYNVPVLAYSEDGLSLIATQIGKPVMLDAFTSSMCVESWGRISFACALIKVSSASTLKKVMDELKKLSELSTNGSLRIVLNAKVLVIVTIYALNVLEMKFLRLHLWRLPKPNSKVHWQPKKSVDSKGGSNTTYPNGTTKESDKGVKVSSPSRANQNMTTPLSNYFDVLNTAEKEDVQNPKVSDHAGTSSLNLHVNKDQEESLWSWFNKGKENAKSKSSELEDESDDDEVYMPHGGGFTDGMEDDLE
ncbi:putative reverse transcriptase domain-containing protein [Tanacetum coccineum]